MSSNDPTNPSAHANSPGHANPSGHERAAETTPEHRRILLDVAAAAIERGLSERQEVWPIAVEQYPESLREWRACFVTLRIQHKLRGCMGSLEATEPLVVNVARNAYSAAFRDPRFAPLVREEFPRLTIHLSLLGPPEPVPAESEAQLLSLIRPGIDGLTLIEGSRRTTLLPAVWESLGDPREFLLQLKRKAGLAADYWSPTLRVERYAAESVGAED